MIDNPAHVQRLSARLAAALPLPATLPQPVAAQLGGASVCLVTAISYAGDEGGLMCTASLPNDRRAHLSITLLRFDPANPLTREIALYQKRRTKRIRRQA